MRKVRWFPLDASTANVASHACPTVCKPVHVGMRQGRPVVWVEVDPAAPEGKMVTCIVGTGWDVPENMAHAGTYIDGDFVWHVYWRMEGL